MKLRVWHIPQIPGISFYVEVSTPKEGKKIMDILSIYDQFQFQNKIKPDFSNACGLEYFDEETNQWTDWESKDGETADEKFGDKFVDKLVADNNIKFY